MDLAGGPQFQCEGEREGLNPTRSRPIGCTGLAGLRALLGAQAVGNPCQVQRIAGLGGVKIHAGDDRRAIGQCGMADGLGRP